MNIERLQGDMKLRGMYEGLVDGIWGQMSEAAYRLLLGTVAETKELAWGSKVSDAFKQRVVDIAQGLGVDPNYLMACIAWETNETFSPSVVNMAGSGATGLIQFMPKTAVGLGTTTDYLASLDAVEQLDYVEKYFLPYRGRLHTLSDVYMSILWPAGIGKPESHALWNKATRPTTYRQNAGLDVNRDGAITKAEAASKVQEKLMKGISHYLG